MKQTLWDIDTLDAIGGHRTTAIGSPRLIETPVGRAVEFDGKGDALLVDAHPLAGVSIFTAEVIFCPYAGGLKEQRFFHLQENDSEDRMLFELRLTDDGRWFLDTFVKSGEGNYTLYAEAFRHPIGPWYHAAIVVDGRQMRHYVNGAQELSKEIAFAPQRRGQTSIGVRMNRVCWFKGAIRQARFTPEALSPDAFLKP